MQITIGTSTRGEILLFLVHDKFGFLIIVKHPLSAIQVVHVTMCYCMQEFFNTTVHNEVCIEHAWTCLYYCSVCPNQHWSNRELLACVRSENLMEAQHNFKLLDLQQYHTRGLQDASKLWIRLLSQPDQDSTSSVAYGVQAGACHLGYWVSSSVQPESYLAMQDPALQYLPGSNHAHCIWLGNWQLEVPGMGVARTGIQDCAYIGLVRVPQTAVDPLLRCFSDLSGTRVLPPARQACGLG